MTHEWFVIDDGNTRRTQPLHERCKVDHQERGVSLARRTEVDVDAEMDLEAGLLEPAATTISRSARRVVR